MLQAAARFSLPFPRVSLSLQKLARSNLSTCMRLPELRTCHYHHVIVITHEHPSGAPRKQGAARLNSLSVTPATSARLVALLVQWVWIVRLGEPPVGTTHVNWLLELRLELAVRIGLSTVLGAIGVDVVPTALLYLSNGAILVGYQNCLELEELFSQLGVLRVKLVVLTAIDLDFGLEVGQPLLLSLTTFERSNSAKWLVMICERLTSDLPVSF